MPEAAEMGVMPSETPGQEAFRFQAWVCAYVRRLFPTLSMVLSRDLTGMLFGRMLRNAEDGLLLRADLCRASRQCCGRQDDGSPLQPHRAQTQGFVQVEVARA